MVPRTQVDTSSPIDQAVTLLDGLLEVHAIHEYHDHVISYATYGFQASANNHYQLISVKSARQQTSLTPPWGT